MTTIQPVKVFLDNCIISLADTMQSAFKEVETKWAGGTHKGRVIGYIRKPLPPESQKFKRNQILALPTVGRLARENIITLYIYLEIQFEGWKRQGSSSRVPLGNSLSGIEFHNVEAAIERSYFMQMEGSEYIKKQRLIEFCQWLLKVDGNESAKIIGYNKNISQTTIEGLKNVHRFRELCKNLPIEQYPDAFHLWTADRNNADFFLTADSKFIRTLTKNQKLILPCEPISPSDLLKRMNITELDEFQYRESIFYNIFGVPV